MSKSALQFWRQWLTNMLVLSEFLKLLGLLLRSESVEVSVEHHCDSAVLSRSVDQWPCGVSLKSEFPL